MATKKNITYGTAAADKLSELRLCFHYSLAVIKRTNRNGLQLVYALNVYLLTPWCRVLLES